MKRLLLCVRKPIGGECLDIAFAEHGRSPVIAGVVSNLRPDGWWKSRGVADRATKAGLEVFPSGRKNEGFLDFVQRTRAEYLISVQHPWILSPPVIGAVGGRAFNLHLAPLPEYKGWHGCPHAILNDNPIYRVVLHWMAPELDSGDIAYEAAFPIAPDETAASLYAKASAAGVSLFEALLHDLASDVVPPRRPMTVRSRMYRRDDLDRYREVVLPVEPPIIERLRVPFTSRTPNQPSSATQIADFIHYQGQCRS
jgi:folate-dependent phosphoribosylglycinamide formyltransferase PurN